MERNPSGEIGVPRVNALTCAQATALLVEYVAGDLPTVTAQAFQEHVRLCKDCAAYLRTYQATIATTRAVRYDDIPDALQERLTSFLRERGALRDE